MTVIDLHGLREDEAIGPIQMAFMDLLDERIDEVNIITGNGQVLRDLVIELANEDNLHWTTEGTNTGSLIITK